MSGKVFISCGQANPQEIAVASGLSAWFKSEGYDPYVAIQTQSILDLNNGIISELKRADLYLFVNFRRDKITTGTNTFHRGSVFTNQELGIAYAMGFVKCLFVNQKDVKREGIFQYMVSNIPEFDQLDEVLPIVKTAVAAASWQPNYSRNLVYHNLRWSGHFNYRDHTGAKNVKALHIDISNNRPDQGASNTVARMKSITINGITSIPPDRSHLKCSGAPGYSNTIWPNDFVAFDLLSIDLRNQSNIYLNSALDVMPRIPLIQKTGSYVLVYEVFAESFPTISFSVELIATGNEATTTAKLL